MADGTLAGAIAAPHPDAGAGLVLIVDDLPENLAVLHDVLDESGYTVLVATDGPSALVWATLLGWIVFADFPDGWTLIGMGIIAASGLLVTWHERRTPRGMQPIPEPTVVD